MSLHFRKVSKLGFSGNSAQRRKKKRQLAKKREFYLKRLRALRTS